MLSQNLSACSCNHSCSACSMNPHVVQGKLAHCLPWAHCYVNGFMALREAYWTSMQACLLTWHEIELYTGVNVPLKSFIWYNKLHTHTWSGWKNHWKIGGDWTSMATEAEKHRQKWQWQYNETSDVDATQQHKCWHKNLVCWQTQSCAMMSIAYPQQPPRWTWDIIVIVYMNNLHTGIMVASLVLQWLLFASKCCSIKCGCVWHGHQAITYAIKSGMRVWAL